MSEDIRHDEPLEQHLRAHYASELGQPPSPASVWASLQEKLPSPSHREANSPPAVQWRPAPTRPAAPFPASSHQTRAHKLRSALSIVAAVLLVALFATVLLHPFGRTGGTTPTATPDESLPAGFTVHVLAPDEVWRGTTLSDLQMLSADEGWAVGAHQASNSFESVILRYAHGKWSASRDVFPKVYLTSISMLSSTDGWASGGGSSTDAAALLHYSGGHWISVKAPGQGEIDQLTMLTPHDGWAIQYAPIVQGSTITTSLLHYDGTAWSTVDTGGVSLTSLAMLSSSEGWAAGQDGVIAHFHNGTWTRWPTTAPGDLHNITMASPTEGWMTGLAPGYNADPNFRKPHHMFVLHYNGHEWQPVTLPELPNLLTVYPSATHFQNSSNIYSISAMSMVSSAEGWAAGSLDGGFASILYHYSGGKWHLYPFGVNTGLSKIQMVSAGEGWAIGTALNYDTESEEDATILHYTQGSWTIYKP
ncbi:MAG TPA: hypothetical protein VF510_20825 [Ktedonobacterales bacterium]